jgi:hypothetical protein
MASAPALSHDIVAHAQASEAPARSCPVGEIYCRFGDGRSRRTFGTTLDASQRVCPEWRPQRWSGASGLFDARAATIHSQEGRTKALGISKRQIDSSFRSTKDRRVSPSRRGRLMTVCIAAIAGEGSKFLICVADKALTFGSHIQWDADSSKITTLDNNKTLILMAGSESPIDRVIRKLNPITDEWSGDRFALMSLLEKRFREAFSEEQEISLLHPQMFTREEYLTLMASGQINRHIEDLAAQIQSFQFDCAFLIVGFDKDARPYLYF